MIQYTKVAAIFLMGEIVSELKDTYDIMVNVVAWKEFKIHLEIINLFFWETGKEIWILTKTYIREGNLNIN